MLSYGGVARESAPTAVGTDNSADHLNDDPEKHAIYNTQGTCVSNLEYFYIDFRHLDNAKFRDHYAVKDAVLNYTLDYDKIGLAYVTIENDFAAGEVTFKPIWQMSGTQFIPLNGDTGHTPADKLLDPETGLMYNNDP